jgi:hypothetical protein
MLIKAAKLGVEADAAAAKAERDDRKAALAVQRQQLEQQRQLQQIMLNSQETQNALLQLLVQKKG